MTSLTWDGPRKHSKGLFCECNRNSFGGQDLSGRQDRVEGNVGEDIDYGNQRNRNGNRSWQVLDGILQLLNNEIQIVPSVVCK